MLRVLSVDIITDLGNKTTTVGQSFDIKILAVQNDWVRVKEDFTNWNDVKLNFSSWNDIKNY